MDNKEILSRIFQALRPYRSRMIISMVAMAGVALCTGAQTFMVKDFLDKIFIAKNEFYLYSLTLVLVFADQQ